MDDSNFPSYFLQDPLPRKKTRNLGWNQYPHVIPNRRSVWWPMTLGLMNVDIPSMERLMDVDFGWCLKASCSVRDVPNRLASPAFETSFMHLIIDGLIHHIGLGNSDVKHMSKARRIQLINPLGMYVRVRKVGHRNISLWKPFRLHIVGWSSNSRRLM